MSKRIFLFVLLVLVVCLEAIEFSEEQSPEQTPAPNGVIFCKDTKDRKNPNQEKTDLKDMWEEVPVRPGAPFDKQTMPK